MIFLEIPFFRHYVFCVVQTSSSPTHPGGNPPLIRYACAKEPSDGADGARGVDFVDFVDFVDRTQTPRTTHRAPRILPLLFSRKRRKAPSQPGRLRYFLNRMHAHPSKQQPFKNFSYYYHPESCFLGKIFKNQMRKLLALKAFLIFEIFLNFLIFR